AVLLGPEVLTLVAQRLVERLGFGVLDLVVGERRQRVRQAWREVVELLSLAPCPLLVVEPVERLALEIEELLQLLAHLGERAPEIDLAVARAPRLAQLLQPVLQPQHPAAPQPHPPMAAP